MKKILIILLVTIGLSFLIGKALDQRFRQRWDTLFLRAADTLVSGKVPYDIIYMGNSRINYGINPYYVDSMLNTNSYNFALGSMGAEYFKMITTVYLKKRTPKIICIGVDEYTYRERDPLAIAYPFLFYANEGTIAATMSRHNFPMKVIKYFPFIKYAYMDEYYKNSLLNKTPTYPVFEHNTYNGFINIHKDNKTVKALFDIGEDDDVISYKATQQFKDLIQKCKKTNTQLVFIYPPQRKVTGQTQSRYLTVLNTQINLLMQQHGIPLIDCRSLPQIVDADFSDEIHLNEPGSRVFTKHVAEKLRPLLP